MTLSEKKETMALLVRQWKDSGVTQAQYAAQNNLTLVKFRYWIKKFKEPTNAETGFVQLNGFLPQSIILRYPNGLELVLPTHTPVNVLNSLIHFEVRCSR